VSVLPAIELQTREEIHSLCLFDILEQIQAFFEEILPTFPDIKNNAEYFGEQFVVDASGEFIHREERLLITSCSLSLKEAWQTVQKHKGLLIPAHVNRTAFGMLPVLGFTPQDITLEILEISRHLTPAQVRAQFPQLAGYHLIQSGDAHQLDEILGLNQFRLAEATISEIVMAIKHENGRSHQILSSNNT